MQLAMVWIALGATLVSAFAAIAGRLLRDFPGYELETYCRKFERLDLFDEIIRSRESTGIVVEAIQMCAIAVASVFAVFAFVDRLSPGSIPVREAAVAVLLIAIVLTVTNSWLPGIVAKYSAAPFLFHTWRIWRIASRIVWPVAVGFRFVSRFSRRLFGHAEDEQDDEEALEEEIRSIVTAGERTGLLEEGAADMIENVIELDDTTVDQIMTPFSRIDSLDAETAWDDMIEFVLKVRRSRIPVYQNKADNIVGVLVVKDLLPVLSKRDVDTPQTLQRFLREPHFVPDTNNVDELLQHFLKSQNHLSIVIDEYRNVRGVVTIEDVLEEIVGEIHDESDRVGASEVLQIDRNTADVLASTHVDDINKVFGCDLPVSDEYDTISGLVLSQLHDIPREGDSLIVGDVRIEITQASRRAISRLRLMRINAVGS